MTTDHDTRGARTKLITICGSSRFCGVMAVCAWLLERDERAMTMGLHLLPDWYATKCADHLAEAEGCAAEMDELHLRKIDVSDEIFVVDFGGYIGESTDREIRYAVAAGKTVRYYSSDPVGRIVDDMIHAVSSPERRDDGA